VDTHAVGEELKAKIQKDKVFNQPAG